MANQKSGLLALAGVTCDFCGAALDSHDPACTTCHQARPGLGWSPDIMVGTGLPDPEGWIVGARLEDQAGVARYAVSPPPTTTWQGAYTVYAMLNHDLRSGMTARNVALGAVRHKNVATVLGFGQIEGIPYLLDGTGVGRSAAEVLKESGAMTNQDVLRIGARLAEALAEIHGRGLVHGHVCLDSVCMKTIDGQSEPVLCHFPPIAQHDSFPHAAPEVQLGGRADPRSDLFGLGYVLLSLLRGAPADGDGHHPSWKEMTPGPAVMPPKSASLTANHRDLLLSLVDRIPDHRPRSAVEVSQRFRDTSGPPPVHQQSALKPAMIGLGVLGLAAITIGGWFLWSGSTESPADVHPPVVVPPAPITTATPATTAPAQAPSTPVEESPSEQDPPIPAEPTPTTTAPPLKAAKITPPPSRGASPQTETTTASPPPKTATPEPESQAAPPEPTPIVEAPPSFDVTSLSGTWQGRTLKRPMEAHLTISPDNHVAGTIMVTVGSMRQERQITGSVTVDSHGAGTIQFAETGAGAAASYQGTIEPNSAGGDVIVKKKTRGTWSISK